MTPEESFAEHVIWILSQLKEASFATLEGESVEYMPTHVFAAGVPSQDTENKILHKIQELGAIKIVDTIDQTADFQEMYYIEIHEPQFTEIYTKYKKISSKGSKLINSFSQSNLPFVLFVLAGVASAAEFSSSNEVHYSLQSSPGNQLMKERQLLTKLQSLGVLRYDGEDGIYGVASLSDVDAESINDAAKPGFEPE